MIDDDKFRSFKDRIICLAILGPGFMNVYWKVTAVLLGKLIENSPISAFVTCL